MKHHQRIAFNNPCRLAGETVNPIFGRLLSPMTSAVVTINTGYE